MKHIIGLNLILGLWLLVSAIAFGPYPAGTAAMWTDVIVGLAIIGCAWCVLAELPGAAACSVCSVLCGTWLLLEPIVLNYPVTAFSNEVMIVALAVVISAIETWRISHRPPTPA